MRYDMTFGPEQVFLAIFFLWALVLTFFFLRFYLFYMKIKKGTKAESIIPILNELVVRDREIGRGIGELEKKVAKLESESQFFIQKIGMTRFNPFNDTGGDQSFILALLDSHNTGVVISSLHTRTGARWYAKKIENGEGSEHKLSSEEKDAVAKARLISKGI